ncbi:MAG: peptidylprolyl isomerase [Rhodospirillales bacterium]|nr:peptidylprolyl isomerase [Rhodospirillales bacterium]
MMTDQTETQADEGASPLVTFETTHGSFAVALEPDSAPKTVENFLAYVRDGHYDGTIFHRIIAGFMIQGGGYDERYQQLPTRAPIENEAPDAPGNDRGTIAMARTADPHSATAQFFINVVDNDFLNHRGKNPQGWGYAAFGRVVDGMETVDRIAALQTGPGGPFPSDVPKEAVVIEKVTAGPGS